MLRNLHMLIFSHIFSGIDIVKEKIFSRKPSFALGIKDSFDFSTCIPLSRLIILQGGRVLFVQTEDIKIYFYWVCYYNLVVTKTWSIFHLILEQCREGKLPKRKIESVDRENITSYSKQKYFVCHIWSTAI